MALCVCGLSHFSFIVIHFCTSLFQGADARCQLRVLATELAPVVASLGLVSAGGDDTDATLLYDAAREEAADSQEAMQTRRDRIEKRKEDNEKHILAVMAEVRGCGGWGRGVGGVRGRGEGGMAWLGVRARHPARFSLRGPR